MASRGILPVTRVFLGRSNVSIYGGRRGWGDLNDVVQPVTRPRPAASAPSPFAPTSEWTSVRKARPAEYLLPQSEKWFDALPSQVMPCALATAFPRIVNVIVAQWKDHRGAPELFEELLGDRRGGRAGFPPAVRRDLLKLQEFWYSGTFKAR
jgi:hypothetical protein